MSEVIHSKQHILATLQENRDRMKALGVKKLGLFGSFARNRPRADSDVDVLVEFEPDRKTFDNFTQLAFMLEDLLGRPVELVTTESLSPYLRPYIRKRSNMSRSRLEYLRHILDEADYLVTHSRGVSKGQFVQDETLKPAFVRIESGPCRVPGRVPDVVDMEVADGSRSLGTHARRPAGEAP